MDTAYVTIQKGCERFLNYNRVEKEFTDKKVTRTYHMDSQ